MNKYSTVDSNEKASAFMDARLWEFIDMAAMWPKAKPDSRIWDHVMVYAPKQPEQEPVAWRFRTSTFWNREMLWQYLDSLEGTKGLLGLQPLYTAPQKKEWVGLTLLEIEKCIYDANDDPIVACRNVEAKLKELNHD